ncbi:hypothetical protein JCM24511_03939 [Saitozyma sp. JCM 24511]|nr:hypothetical protein JCM24511_03939 [Saitozyma sp. JCM 24511]
MATQLPPAQALAAHLLSQTTASVSVLETLGVISSQDASLIRSKLPPPSGPFPSLNPPQRDLSSSFSSMNIVHQSPSYGQPMQQQQQQHQLQQPIQSPPAPPPAPALPPRGRPESRAKALWDYNGSEADDLTFRSGDTIIIDEEVNDQWYRGRVIPQGQSYPLERRGLFPSNYIEKLSSVQSPSYFPPQPPTPTPGAHAMVPYQHSGPPQGYYDQKQPMYPPQQGQMVMMPPQQQVQGGVMVQQPQNEEPKKGKFGKLGGQLGNAAVTGAGFGFGSAVAGELVHAIF